MSAEKLTETCTNVNSSVKTSTVILAVPGDRDREREGKREKEKEKEKGLIVFLLGYSRKYGRVNKGYREHENNENNATDFLST